MGHGNEMHDAGCGSTTLRTGMAKTRRIFWDWIHSKPNGRGHDTQEDRGKHRVCYSVNLLSAHADLADDEMFAYTHVEKFESDRIS